MQMQGHHGHLSAEQKQLAFRLRQRGWRLTAIAREIGCTAPMVGLMVRSGKHLDAAPFGWEPRSGSLTIQEREQILFGIGRGDSLSEIARSLERSPSTVTREVNANGGREQYSAWHAHARARQQARRPKPCKLQRGRLLREVSKRLEQLWSPEEIARRLPLEYPDDPEMRVSHETIYQSLFVQGRGEQRRELARCLRSGRTVRRSRDRVEKRGRLPGMVMISDRPAEVEDRAVPGHWEGDLILGEGGRSAVGTLVERTTRLLLLLDLAGDRSAEAVEAAMRKAISTLPAELCRSITWDQGAEMAKHADFSLATGIPIFFCDPHSPWQRGSNENTNGLLRQYLPKGTDLSKQTAADLRRIQRSLNGRPRKTLGFMTPSEKFAELVAATV
jgi:IS30 family transposase